MRHLSGNPTNQELTEIGGTVGPCWQEPVSIMGKPSVDCVRAEDIALQVTVDNIYPHTGGRGVGGFLLQSAWEPRSRSDGASAVSGYRSCSAAEGDAGRR